jgi:hypothetical protein
MNHRQKPPQLRIKTPAYRRAFERLNAALEENTRPDNPEKIRLRHIALFGEVKSPAKSG